MTDWRPTSSELAADRREDIISSSQNVVLHFWANWNLHDRRMDAAIQNVRSDFPTINFFACNTDIPENHAFCKQCNITNIPALAFFVKGQLKDTSIGLRSSTQLRQLFLNWSNSPS